MTANQLRLWFASMAYVLVDSLRRIALQATDLADASCGTIRRKLFKIGALVTISVRRIKLAMGASPRRGHMSEVQESTTVSYTIGAVSRENSRNGSSFNIARSISSRAAAG